MIQLFANFFGAIKEFFSFKNKKIDHNNTEPMKDRQNAQKEIEEVSRIEKAVKDKNTDEIRNALAE